MVGTFYDETKRGEKLVIPRLGFMLTLMKVLNSFPLRYSALHMCMKAGTGDLNEKMNDAVFQHAIKVFPQYARVRLRLHYGTDMEMQYSLRSHGFPKQSFPVSVVDGTLRMDILNTWFYQHKASAAVQSASVLNTKASRDDESWDDMDLLSDDLDEQLEEYKSGFSNTEVLRQNETVASMDGGNGSTQDAGSQHPVRLLKPTENDVLLGRGRGVQHHEGNVRFRKILEGYRLDYDRAPRKSKRQYSAAVTHFLLGSGTRFLQRTENGDWEASSFEEALRKVSQL